MNTAAQPIKSQLLAPKKRFAAGKFFLQWGTILMVVILVLVFQILQKRFLAPENIFNILRSASILLLLTLALSVVVAVGGFDLSFGMMASLASVLSAAIMVWLNYPIWVAILVPILLGIIVGIINGALIQYLGIKDVLATLGVSFIIGGLHLTIGQGNSIHNFMTNPWTKLRALGEIGPGFRFLATGNLGPIPVLVLIAFGVAAIVHIFMTYSRWGRYMYVIGGNPEAAYLAGINVKRVSILAYVICAVLSGVAGVLLTARVGSGQLNIGENYFMEALLGCFVGFTIFGAGKANVPGAIVGAVFATIIVNGLTMLGVHPYSVDIFKGLALVLAIGLQSYQYIRSKKH